MACNGLCLTGADIGLGGSGVAYAHPTCPEHGEPHPFEFGGSDLFGRLMCDCGGYQVDHEDQVTKELLELEIQRESAGGYDENAVKLRMKLTILLARKAKL